MKKTYSEKLQDPRWQKKRLQILSRDGFTCQICAEDSYELHIHHLKYNNEPWDANNDDLITYCKFCHILTEDTKKEKRYSFLGAYTKKLFTSDRKHHMAFMRDHELNLDFISIADITNGSLVPLASFTQMDVNRFNMFFHHKNNSHNE